MSRISKPQASDLSLLLLNAMIWGSALTAMKLVVDDLGAFWTAAFRVGIGFMVAVPFFIWKPQWPRSASVWAAIALVALLNMVVPFILISWAMFHIGAGIGSLLLGTTPFIAMVMGHFLTQDERITPFKVVAVILAISGVAVLARADLHGIGATALLAQLAVILSGVCYVSAGFAMRRMDLEPIAFTTLAMGIGTVMLFVVSLIWVGIPTQFPEGFDLLALLWLGAFPTGFSYMMRYFLVRRVGVSTFALAMNLVPVFGIMIAAYVLGETIESTTLLALALVLTGLAITRADPAVDDAGKGAK